MKTKFILHGGCTSRDTEENRKFFLETVDSVKSDKVIILCVYFARPRQRWEESFEEDKAIFLSLGSQKKLDIRLATLDKAELIDQIKISDVIFINGGMRGCLKETLENLENFPELIKGKVVVGISAGANILAKYYYSSVAQGIREGIGLLPIKTFCHYREEDVKELKELEDYKENLPIYKIPEEKFIAIETDN